MKLDDVQRRRIKRALANMKGSDDIVDSEVRFQGRTFYVEYYGPRGLFKAYEIQPSGVVFRGGDPANPANYDRSHVDDIKKVYQENPNALAAFCESRGIDPDQLVGGGTGHGIGTIYQDSLEEAIEVVLAAIENNRPLISWRAPEPKEPTIGERRAELQDALRFWQGNRLPDPASPSLLADKANGFGQALKKEYRDEIMGYLNRPTLKKWESVRNILVTPLDTVWQVMVKHDPSTPRGGDGFTEDNIPAADVLAAALTGAVTRHNQKCDAKIAEAQRALDALDESEPQHSASEGPGLG